MDFTQYVTETKGLVEKALGADYIVETMSKDLANGGKATGLGIRKKNAMIGAVLYLDNKESYTMEDAEKKAKEIVKNYRINAKVDDVIDKAEKLKSWEYAKEHLTARLYNKTTKAEVFKSAAEYGFDDLIIVPYIEVKMGKAGDGVVKVTQHLLDTYEVTAEEVIEIALANAKEKVKLTNMVDFMAEQTGLPAEIFGLPMCMQIVSNNEGAYGAISVIVAKDKLDEIFEHGYVVLPSSLHECIVVPIIDGNENRDFSEMVKAVNATEVREDEQLSDHVYIFE